MEEIYATFATQNLFRLLIVLVGIMLSWWALKTVRFELFVRDLQSPQSKLLQVILAVVLGYQLGKFFIDYMDWSLGLRGLF